MTVCEGSFANNIDCPHYFPLGQRLTHPPNNRLIPVPRESYSYALLDWRAGVGRTEITTLESN